MVNMQRPAYDELTAARLAVPDDSDPKVTTTKLDDGRQIVVRGPYSGKEKIPRFGVVVRD